MASVALVASIKMSTFLWTFGGLTDLSGLDGNVHIFVDIFGGLGGLGGTVHIFVDILGGLSGLSDLDRNVHPHF